MPRAPSDLPPGFVVGEYRIEKIIGRGGMGTVYAAIHPVIEKKVAIKVLGTHWASSPDLVSRFVDEARAVNRIGHENIIDIFSFGQLADGRHYFVMEYLQGATLGDRLERGDLPREEIGPLLVEVCEALEAAHAKKIVHRDLKLDNVWVAQSNRGRPTVRLLDFGIAKLLETGDRVTTDTGAVMGTPQYMSPEQCHGSGVDHRTDIYAMGVMLYRVYGGRLPIEGDTFASILCKQLTELPPPPSTYAPVPPDLDRLIMSCLEKDPERRPQSAGALATALACMVSLTAVPGGSQRVSVVPVDSVAALAARAGSMMRLDTAGTTAPAATGRRGLWLVSLVAALAATVVVGFVWRTRHPGPSPSALTSETASATTTKSTTSSKPASDPSAPTTPRSPDPPAKAPISPSATTERTAAMLPARHHTSHTKEAVRPSVVEPAVSPTPPSKALSKGLATDNPFR